MPVSTDEDTYPLCHPLHARPPAGGCLRSATELTQGPGPLPCCGSGHAAPAGGSTASTPPLLCRCSVSVMVLLVNVFELVHGKSVICGGAATNLSCD